jgi:hypothetical protein
MSIHPSLISALELPPPLYPQRVMEPYVECWCRSGKKWKFCHKDRHKQKQIDIHEHTLQMRKAFNRGYCSHPEASLATCRHGIIKSHTVQRKGGLAAIADSGNHVVSFKAAFDDILKNDGEIIPKRVGYRIASTFMGFCALHDNQMFKPIESGVPVIDLETSFLLSFRAMAYEVYQKEMAISLIPLELELDRGRSFEEQAMIQSYYHDYHIGEKLGIIEQKAFKSEYDKAYISNDFRAPRKISAFQCFCGHEKAANQAV